MLNHLFTLLLLLLCFNLFSQPTVLVADQERQPNESVCIPISVNDFTDITEMRFTLSWESDKLEFQSVNGIDANFINSSFYEITNAANGIIILDWSTSLPTGVTLADGSDIFEVCFTVLGNCSDYAALRVGNIPQPVEVLRVNTGNNNIGLFYDDPGWVGICTPNNGRLRDSLALIALWNATHDNGAWTNEWDLTMPMETWFGVELNSEGRVTCLDLDGTLNCTPDDTFVLFGNNLQGILPSQIGHLERLQQLYLSNNRLSGNILPEIGYLKDLQSLFISNTRMAGTLPIQLGQLNNLIELQLSNSRLTGNIPIEIGLLIHLEELHLDGNQLNGSIPNEIGQLTQLREIVLSRNKLTGNIPAEIAQLNNLKKLHLRSNNLDGCYPASLITHCNLGYAGPISNDGYNFHDNPLLPWEGDFTRFCAEEEQISANCNDGNEASRFDQINAACECKGQIPEIFIIARPDGCNGVNSGQLTAFPVANEQLVKNPVEAGYTIEWNDGDTQFERTHLVAGLYSATVTSPSNEMFTESATLTEAPILTVEPELTNATCTGSNDGAFELEPKQGGSHSFGGEFTFGVYVASNNRLVIDDITSENFFIGGVDPLDYLITIEDNNNCLLEQIVTVEQNKDITLTNSIITNPSCGEMDGQIEIVVSTTGEPPAGTWTFEWMKVNTNGSISSIHSQIQIDGNSSVVSNLGEFVYRVRVTDSDPAGCEALYTFDLTQCSMVLNNQLTTFGLNQIDANIYLDWQTETENNLSDYHIQRSINTQNWQTIGKQNAMNKSNYEFIDQDVATKFAANARLYYRLEMVDQDGSMGYSPIRSVMLQNGQSDLNIYPNPTTGKVTVDIVGLSNRSAQLEIFNLNGQIVQRISLQATDKNTLIDLRNLARGMYLVKFNNGENVSNQRLLLH